MPFTVEDLRRDNELIAEINRMIEEQRDSKDIIERCNHLREQLLRQRDLIDEQLDAMKEKTFETIATENPSEPIEDKVVYELNAPSLEKSSDFGLIEVEKKEIVPETNAAHARSDIDLDATLENSSHASFEEIATPQSEEFKAKTALVDGTSLAKGTEVVAKVVLNEAENWILASVVDYDVNLDSYTVEDAEVDEATNAKSKYTLQLSRLASLHSRHKEFPASANVIALYPGSTCFYNAKIVLPPSKRKKINEYLVEFEDDFVDGILVKRNVAPKYVVKPF